MITLWQSGEEFEKAGGKRERGPAVPGRARHRQDDDLQGDRDQLQLPVRDDPGLGLRRHVHRHGCDHRPVPGPQGAQAGGQVGRPVHRLHRRDRRRRHAPPGARGRHGHDTRPPSRRSIHDFCFYGPNGSLTSSGDLIVESRAWRERLFAQRAESPSRRLRDVHGPDRPSGSSASIPASAMGGGMGGGMALNQLLVVMDGIDEPPLMRKVITNRVNTFLDAMFIVPRKVGKLRLRLRPPKPAPGADLLHRRLQRPDQRARSGADPPGPDGPPHLVPHADQGRPAGHPRPLPGQGRPRARPRHRPPPRRAGADHQRLLAVDDRAVLLDGADDRPHRGPAASSPGATSSRR